MNRFFRRCSSQSAKAALTAVIFCVVHSTMLNAQLSCRAVQKINLGLGAADCTASISEEMIIDNYNAAIPYIITIVGPDGQTHANAFDVTDIGQLFEATITLSPSDGTSCSVDFTVDFHQKPILDCSSITNTTLSCVEFESFEGPDLSSPHCAGFEIHKTITEVAKGVCGTDAFIKKVVVQYQAVDIYGNASNVCEQEFELLPIDLSTVSIDDIENYPGTRPNVFIDIPNNITVSCDEPLDPAPMTGSGTGVPYFYPLTGSGTSIYPGIEKCNLFSDYEDKVLLDNGCSQKIRRTWTIVEWFCNNFPYLDPSPVQIITVKNDKGPQIKCPAGPIMASTGGYDCTLDIDLPAATVEANGCSDNNTITFDMVVLDTFGVVQYQFDGQNGGMIDIETGEYVVRYVATDDCGYSSSCEMDLIVRDNNQPTVLCNRTTSVSINSSGSSIVHAEVFDDGSYDECKLSHFEVRKMTDNCDMEENLEFGPFVTFCCGDMGSTVMVEVRVYDASGNFNSCMVEVNIQNKNVPFLSCPPDITVSCDFNYDSEDLSVFGSVVDAEGDREAIIIDDPLVAFSGDPRDGIITGMCGSSLTYSDERDVTDCGTGTIYRTWSSGDVSCTQEIHIVSRLPFDGNITWPMDYTATGVCAGINTDPEDLPDGFGYPSFAEGVSCDLLAAAVIDDEYLDVPGDGNTCFKLLRTWSVINWCDRDPDTNAPRQWTYVQTIKGLNEIPVLVNCDPIDATVTNCTASEFPITLSATDDCTQNSDFTWTFHFYNLDGSVDTSGTTYPEGIVAPPGEYTLDVTVTDECEGVASCSIPVTLEVNKGPVAACINNLTANLTMMDPDGDGIFEPMVMVAPDVFDASSSAACGTGTVSLSFSTLPNDVILAFDCDDVGTEQPVELWVTDTNGEQSFCTTSIEITDLDDLCSTNRSEGEGTVVGEIYTDSQKLVSSVSVQLIGNTTDITETDEKGKYSFGSMPYGSNYQVTPIKSDDPMNGVSTLDLVLLQKHILGLEEFNNPYQYIAGDINNSQTLSASDIVELRKMILGIQDDFSNNTSWKFVWSDYEFISSKNPLAESYMETYDINSLQGNMQIDYVAVKIGDISGDVKTNSVRSPIEVRSQENAVKLIIEDRAVEKDEVFTLEMTAVDFKNIYGFQFTLVHPGLEILDASSKLIDVDKSNFGNVRSGISTFSWHDIRPNSSLKNDVVLQLKVRSLYGQSSIAESMTIGSMITKAEAYRGDSYSSVGIELETGILDNGSSALLMQNQPNPWSASTSISFYIPESDDVHIQLYDLTGRLFWSHRARHDAGQNRIDISSDQLPNSGVYIYELQYRDTYSSKRMILTK